MLEFVAAYGGRCFCCGETEPMFLSIDHVNGGGLLHRKAAGMYGTNFYRWLKKNGFPKKGLRLACLNCNLGRQRNGGVCPHAS